MVHTIDNFAPKRKVWKPNEVAIWFWERRVFDGRVFPERWKIICPVKDVERTSFTISGWFKHRYSEDFYFDVVPVKVIAEFCTHQDVLVYVQKHSLDTVYWWENIGDYI